MKHKKFNDEVLFSDSAICRLKKSDLDFLALEALKNSRKRIRLCCHRGAPERVHEMFIIHARDAYVRPHKHLGKPESFLVIDGEADVVFFNEEGGVTEKIAMGPPGSGKMFYYRIDEPVFHTLLVRSATLCFKEVTAGPLRKEDTVFAAWAPDETDPAGIAGFLEDLKNETG